MRYLAQFPNAPVKSLQDILDRGDFHAALEATFKLRNAAVPDPEEIRQVQARRQALVAMVNAAFDEHRVEALAYPTLRRRPVVVEETQRGTTCQLSASTGFPAMAMPAGFTTDGVPIGFEMLGPAWSDARLLSLAFAYEQAARPRRAAPTTPPLVNGVVPGSISFEATATEPGASLRVRFDYDPVSGRLSYDFPPRTVAASLHRGAAGAGSPVLHRLIDPASPSMRGMVILPAYQRTALVDGEMSVLAQTGEARVTLPLRVPR